MTLDVKDFEFIADLIKKHSGIALTPDKEYLLESRLVPIAKEHGMAGLKELIHHAKAKLDNKLLTQILEAMTTNESFFFRDTKPFKCLCEIIIPRIFGKAKNKKSVRIWSAACSTGQEPYSIAMSILEDKLLAGITFEIVATDLDHVVLEKAKAGLYTQFEVQRGVPINLLIKYFTQEGDQWRVKDTLKKHVTFKPFNLMDKPVALGTFDIIFCRNVLIYFDEQTKEKVIGNLAQQLEAHGTLVLGSTENMLGMNQGLAPLQCDNNLLTSGVFCPKD